MRLLLPFIAAAALATASPVLVQKDPLPSNFSGSPGHIPENNPAPIPNEYERTGNLTQPPVKPFTPAGGKNVNKTDIPVYEPFSDFDFQSLALALYQEYIELDLFNEGLRRFSDEEFESVGINATERALIQIMANQEIGHAAVISNMLGPNAPEMCEYQYPFETVHDFVDFCQKLTRWGEAGVYGFLPHLDSRPAAQLVLQSITVEARQQMAFRQLEGLPAMVEWHTIGVPQAFAWTLLAPHIKSCPENNTHLVWQNFPALNITNNPIVGEDYPAAVNTNRTALSAPGREILFIYEPPNKPVGPNNTYTTSTSAGKPEFAAWISQLNVTYTPLYGVELAEEGKNGTAKTYQPEGFLWDELNPLVNSTVFVVLTDTDLYLTPHNITIINDHVVAGPAIYQAG